MPSTSQSNSDPVPQDAPLADVSLDVRTAGGRLATYALGPVGFFKTR